MQENKSLEIVFIIDESGSMEGQELDVLTGYNSVLCKYRAMKTPILFTTLFFSYYLKSHGLSTPIAEVAPLKPWDYRPGGGTALYDAIGMTIDGITRIRREYAAKEQPSKTLFFITTDGQENSSRRYDKATITRLIQQKTEEGWQFEFLGAGIDAFEGADDVGISRRNAHSFDNMFDCIRYCDYCIGSLADPAETEKEDKNNGI